MELMFGMVTMTSEKLTRKSDFHQHGFTPGSDSQNQLLIYQKIEKIIEKMRDEKSGIPVKTVKNFLTKIPSIITGSDIITWLTKNLDIEYQAEALHLAHLIASHGYIFPIDDHVLTVKNDNTFYRFQIPYFWPSNNIEPENTDYAVYLCKRTMSNKNKINLAEYEAENFGRLQKMFARKWEFIFMQAEAQSKTDKKKEKTERKILESQERAFWDVHRPMPGCVNTTELDARKPRPAKPSVKVSHCSRDTSVFDFAPTPPAAVLTKTTDALRRQIAALRLRLERPSVNMAKIAESYILYYEQYAEYDAFFTAPEYSNPWFTDNTELWEQEISAKDASARRVKRWAFSLHEILADPLGRQHFQRFLEKEFSSENLKFWEAVQQLKSLPLPQVANKANEIFNEYLAEDAVCPINVDSQSYEHTKKLMEAPNRWTFDTAAAHVFHLMKSDSYPRYVRSDMYKEYLNGSKKKASVKGIRSIVSFSSVKKEPSMTSVFE